MQPPDVLENNDKLPMVKIPPGYNKDSGCFQQKVYHAQFRSANVFHYVYLQ